MQFHGDNDDKAILKAGWLSERSQEKDKKGVLASACAVG
jgi:hypothetical protein